MCVPVYDSLPRPLSAFRAWVPSFFQVMSLMFPYQIFDSIVSGSLGKSQTISLKYVFFETKNKRYQLLHYGVMQVKGESTSWCKCFLSKVKVKSATSLVAHQAGTYLRLL